MRVVLVFPTCKVFSSLGLAVSTFLLYFLTENMPSGANIVRFERAEYDLGVERGRRGFGDSSFVPSSR